MARYCCTFRTGLHENVQNQLNRMRDMLTVVVLTTELPECHNQSWKKSSGDFFSVNQCTLMHLCSNIIRVFLILRSGFRKAKLPLKIKKTIWSREIDTEAMNVPFCN